MQNSRKEHHRAASRREERCRTAETTKEQHSREWSNTEQQGAAQTAPISSRQTGLALMKLFVVVHTRLVRCQLRTLPSQPISDTITATFLCPLSAGTSHTGGVRGIDARGFSGRENAGRACSQFIGAPPLSTVENKTTKNGSGSRLADSGASAKAQRQPSSPRLQSRRAGAEHALRSAAGSQFLSCSPPTNSRPVGPAAVYLSDH